MPKLLSINEIKALALHSAKGTVPANFSATDKDVVNKALKDQLEMISGSLNQFMKNRYDIYDIIIQAHDEVLPKRVIDSLGIFAEIQFRPQGQNAIFTTKLGKNRAKKFLTQVGLSGVYETFRLDKGKFELSGKAIGGAVAIDYERLLDSAEIMSEFLDITLDGIADSVFVETQRALRASLNSLARPAANKVVNAGFDSKKMFKLCGIAKSYADGAVIFAPPEFIAEMGADAIVPVGTNYQGVYSSSDIENIHNNGYIQLFRGTPVVQIPQSYTDETNTTTQIDPQLAYILPSGKGSEKVVKVVIEGDTQISDFKNRDNSFEIHLYRKMACAILTHHNWCIFQNTAIPPTFVDDNSY